MSLWLCSFSSVVVEPVETLCSWLFCVGSLNRLGFFGVVSGFYNQRVFVGQWFWFAKGLRVSSVLANQGFLVIAKVKSSCNNFVSLGASSCSTRESCVPCGCLTQRA